MRFPSGILPPWRVCQIPNSGLTGSWPCQFEKGSPLWNLLPCLMKPARKTKNQTAKKIIGQQKPLKNQSLGLEIQKPPWILPDYPPKMSHNFHPIPFFWFAGKRSSFFPWAKVQDAPLLHRPETAEPGNWREAASAKTPYIWIGLDGGKCRWIVP